ncbi:hypothetical protein [Vibrio sp. TRT 1302]|uniref:hypothetical protein n=1 Tax=Vibrio sp. TRT 1302 TaxID=3418504 RepID=UPI003CF94051
MKVLAIIALAFAPLFASAEAPEIGAGVSGPYVDCQLPDGSMTYTPHLVCKNKGGKQI